MKKQVYWRLALAGAVGASLPYIPMHALTKKQTYAASAAAGTTAAIAGLAAALSYGHQLGGPEIRGTARMAVVGSLLSYLFFRQYLSENDFERTWKPAYNRLKNQHLSFFMTREEGGFSFDWAQFPDDFINNLNKEQKKKTTATYNPSSWYGWVKSFIYKITPEELKKKKLEEADKLRAALEKQLDSLTTIAENFKKETSSSLKKINFQESYASLEGQLKAKIAQLNKNLISTSVHPSTPITPKGEGQFPALQKLEQKVQQSEEIQSPAARTAPQEEGNKVSRKVEVPPVPTVIPAQQKDPEGRSLEKLPSEPKLIIPGAASPTEAS